MSDQPDEPIEFLVSRRSKRSTAGNRMQAALAEMAAEVAIKDVEDDVDFVIEKDEQDVFESDFESTDEEEAAQEEAEAAGERQVNEEERRERSAARSKLEKATAAAHARNKVTFNPDSQAFHTTPKPKPKPRVYDLTEDQPEASTSEIALPGDIISPNRRKRKSLRAQTMQNTTETVKRLKDLERGKASVPRKSKSSAKTFTQAQLLARALDAEEGNIIEHRDYLKNEEAKRKAARVVRPSVTGPMLRWVSKLVDEKVPVEMPPPPPPPPETRFQSPATYGGQSGYGMQYTFTTSTLASTSTSGQAQPPSVFGNIVPQSMTHSSSPPAPGASAHTPPPPAPPPEPEEKLEKVGRNFLIHALSKKKSAKKPTWTQSMEALFGTEVKWDEIKVYSHSKNRPYGRPETTCPFTGKVAPYLDPKSGLPFADAASFQKARRALGHEYMWETGLRRYVWRDEEALGEDKEDEDEDEGGGVDVQGAGMGGAEEVQGTVMGEAEDGRGEGTGEVEVVGETGLEGLAFKLGTLGSEDGLGGVEGGYGTMGYSGEAWEWAGGAGGLSAEDAMVVD
ncbi:YL1 nuclear protein-domain-containing protein [Ephemerocybe angulata]|uniref:YL1 nuclear protein-domain-containing protein n=1 Tax=Ephemerocybe angulata TaxID=980116 RepID=A0A8H6M1T9_9AGAR|nr:YL1 nuclear protein-domain-containing protein [Tulosesus angulatus]